MIPPNNFWWLPQSLTPPPPPHPPHVFIFQANLSGPLSESFQSFQRSPLLGSWVTTDPQGINNDRSLMWFAVIMQHADVAYHVQRAYMGADHLTFKGGGGGTGDLRKRYHEVWSWAQKSLARKYLPYNSFECQGKTFYYQRFWGKKILMQTHEITHTLVKVKWPAPNYM